MSWRWLFCVRPPNPETTNVILDLFARDKCEAEIESICEMAKKLPNLPDVNFTLAGFLL